MNYREACIENLKRANDEIEMFNDVDPFGVESKGETPCLPLKRIPLQAKDINDHEHTEIKPNKTYLVCQDGDWFIGQFKRNYWNTGWEIPHFGYTRNLAMINIIYEIVGGLPEVPVVLLPRIEIKSRTVTRYHEEVEEYGCECGQDECICN